MIASAKSTISSATSQSPSQGPSGTQGYVSIGKASQLLNISRATLRSYEREGRLVSFRTCGSHWGHRRYDLVELKRAVLGVDGSAEAAVDEGKRVCIYCRVSSQGQKESLDRQVERMLATVSERENIGRDSIKTYVEVSSSFGDRLALNKLIDDVLAGRVSRIYCEHKDRLSRVPALTVLVEHLCKSHSVEIVCLDRENDDDVTKNELLDLVNFVSVIANRQSARKAADRKRVVLTHDALSFVRQEIAGGRGVRETVKEANRKGYRDEKGRPLSYRVVLRYMSKVVQKLVPLENVSNSFAEFIGQHVKPKKGSAVQAAAIHSAYQLWAKGRGIVPLSGRKCGDWMQANNMESVNKCGYTWYEDVEIVGYPSVNGAKGEWATKFNNGVVGERVSYNNRGSNAKTT